jgi:hypothetical protein
VVCCALGSINILTYTLQAEGLDVVIRSAASGYHRGECAVLSVTLLQLSSLKEFHRTPSWLRSDFAVFYSTVVFT